MHMRPAGTSQATCMARMNTKHANATGPVTAARVFLTIGAVTLIAGCASEPYSRVVSAPPPSTTTGPATQTIVVPAGGQPVTTTAPAQTIIVQQQPPAVQSESPPPRPSSEYVWVAGYWAWENSRYHWISGRWTIPPRAGSNWVPPRWEPEGRGYRFYDGYWD
jgi:hypothetical protein